MSDPLAHAHQRIDRLEQAVRDMCDLFLLNYHVTGPDPNPIKYRMVELLKKRLNNERD